MKRKTEAAPSAVVIVAGPTASGKSRLALELAERFGGTVINADSQQVYRDLRVLSARPDAAAERRAPHRLYGFLDAGERGSVARWRDLAECEIDAAIMAGRLPVLVGGTGMYLRAVLHGLAPVPDIPAAIRQEGMALYEQLGAEAFRKRLSALDPAAATRLPPGDRQRLLRAWEVVRATGVPLQRWHATARGRSRHRFSTILVMPPRPLLYAACDDRFAGMVQNGALDEVAALATRGLSPDLPVMKAVGVRELFAHMRGEISLAEAIVAGQQATRRYAKRQTTWFRHQLVPDLLIDHPYSPDFLPDVACFIGEFRLTGR